MPEGGGGSNPRSPTFKQAALPTVPATELLRISSRILVQVTIYRSLRIDQILTYKDGPRAKRVNPLTAKSFNLNFHPLEVVSR